MRKSPRHPFADDRLARPASGVECRSVAPTKSAGEILEAVVEDGQEELGRASAGLALSGLAAGLNISFSAVALGAVGAFTGGIGLAAALLYPIGFLIVVLGRFQLFTENTVTPVAVVLTNFGSLSNMLRLWVVIFVSNLIGAVLFAAAAVYGEVLPASTFTVLFDEVAQKLDHGFWKTTLKAVFGGWLVALMAWMVAASRDTISQAFFIYVLAFLIPASGLVHCIAGSSEVLMSVFASEVPFTEYLVGFLVPATLGNAVGGVFLVALLNYGQVAGSDKKTSLSGYTEDQQEGS
ncbi:MAG: Inner membrane protein YfdC [uncultured Rubrobacteraceae bacterium]|uniref:Inner membrane protein YfdC n=1 Tax=uncultured Rubrobacteraceae bacterium TaxID=349277 RepID=A0A6J4Q714_9ACTN|nr:MAG: Inner membrane protein YfdC [uncultured Rubrobacteraceae bacterium]